MRQAPTDSEARLWRALRSSQLGVAFRRQVPPLGFISDFYAPSVLIGCFSVVALSFTYGHIDATGASNGGYGTLSAGVALPDTDRDGMPDYWDRAIGLMPAFDDHTGLVPDCVFAYVPAGLAIPSWRGWLCRTASSQSAALAWAVTFLDVDLRKFTLGLGTATSYSVRSYSSGLFRESATSGEENHPSQRGTRTCLQRLLKSSDFESTCGFRIND